MAFALPVVCMLFLHGEFTWEDALISAQALQVIAISIPALTLIRILVAIFFAMKDTRMPVIASAISVITTAMSGYLLSKEFQVLGLVAALGIGVWIQAIVLLLFLRIKQADAFSCLPILEILKYTLLSCIIAIGIFQTIDFAEWQKGPFDTTNWFVFITVICISIFIYVLILSLAKDQNAQELSRLFKRKIRQN